MSSSLPNELTEWIAGTKYLEVWPPEYILDFCFLGIYVICQQASASTNPETSGTDVGSRDNFLVKQPPPPIYYAQQCKAPDI